MAVFCVNNHWPFEYQLLSPFAPHQKPKDYHLALFVCALVAVDVIILLLFTLVEGLQGNLEPSLVPNTENPSDTQGVSMMQTSIPAQEAEQTRLLHCCAWVYLGETLANSVAYNSAILFELSPMVYTLVIYTFLLVSTDQAGRISILHIHLQLYCPWLYSGGIVWLQGCSTTRNSPNGN